MADVIHAWSPRSSGPLVKVNCAAIPETRLESELFGHEKGAFTGAQSQRVGRFEEANGGTILLDEIAEMSPLLQAKLLHVTQDGRFQRLGSNKECQTNVRILAATNRNLEQEVEKGAFREDLFYRLNVMEISIPPLRERPEDIVPLATHFVAEFSRKPRFSATVTSCLERYEWPGNVRELRNAMNAPRFGARRLDLAGHLPARVRQAGQPPGPPKHRIGPLEDIEREAILQACARPINRTEAARSSVEPPRAAYKLQRFRELGYEVDSH